MWIGADTDGGGDDSFAGLIATELSASGLPVAHAETVEVCGKTVACFVYSN